MPNTFEKIQALKKALAKVTKVQISFKALSTLSMTAINYDAVKTELDKKEKIALKELETACKEFTK